MQCISLKIILFAFISSFVVKINEAQTYTFTNAGATGREGPTQAQIDANYSGTNLAGKVNINTRGIQEWIVPVSGTYKIKAYGAQGGNAEQKYGGKGASTEGYFVLQSNEILKVLVGQQGLQKIDQSKTSNGSGGGGGSFIISSPFNNIDSILVIAGGGGGATSYGSSSIDGKEGNHLPQGTSSNVTGQGTGAGGSAHGGENGLGGGNGCAAGGGGFFGAGNNGTHNATGGSSFLDGGLGGLSTHGTARPNGGFGGGGAGSPSFGYGGGGGGFSGGGGGAWVSSVAGNGGGGGSYNSGTDQNNTSGVNEGHGKVVITFLPPSYTFTNAGAEGREGPTQEQINATYTGTNLDGKVTINTRGIQEWMVPYSGVYRIEAYGAEGAVGDLTDSDFQGGKGAVLSGEFALSASNILKIVVGQKGTSGGRSEPGGGGGGSFVYTGEIGGTGMHIAAGGGGGGGEENTSDGHNGVIDNRGTLHDGNPHGLVGEGGLNGSSASSGAGWKSDGSGTTGKGTRWVGGLHSGADGGFGGGASGQLTNGGGGGGGYSGGSTPDIKKGGGGGGSFNAGTNQNNTTGANEGHGKVIITFLGSSNEAPVISQGAGPLSKVSSEDTQVSWNASDLNATDSDTNSAQLSWSLLSSPSNGTAVVDGNGSSPEVFTYLPNPNYHGSDSFSVQVSDGDSNDSITINLTINPVDDPAVISGDTSGFLLEDSSLTGDLNATDIDGLTDGSYFSISQNPSNGIAAIDAVDGNWTYSPSANFHGTDSFTVTITDDQGYTANQVINLSINPTDDPSIISGDTNASLTEDSFASGDLNVTDIDGLSDGSYFSINSTPTNGTASIDPASGAWSYSPLANFHGSDSFTVTITDDQGYSTSQIISLTVTPIDDQTIVSGEFAGKLYLDHNVSGDINASDIDGLTDGSYFSISTNPANGTAQIDPVTGQWTYSPQSGFLGDDTFTIQITDDQGYTTNQSVTIIPQYNVAVAKMGQPTILDNGNALFSASIIYDGGLPVLEAGFLVSSSPAFTQSTRLPASLEQNSPTFSYEYNLSELASPLYVRAFARNQNGETVSDIKRLNPQPVVIQWSSHATLLDTGWMQSDWFGTFYLYSENWVYHARLGWVYIPDITEPGIWIWSSEHDWLWTQKGVYPHLYKNSSGAWIYLLNQKTQGKDFYDYQSGLFK